MNNFLVFLINQVQVQELQFIKDIWAAFNPSVCTCIYHNDNIFCLYPNYIQTKDFMTNGSLRYYFT